MADRLPERLSRARLIGGALATGALAACGGPASGVATATTCATVPLTGAADRFGVNEMLSDPAFSNVDKAALLATFDRSPKIDALHQPYLSQTAQRATSGYAIVAIPPEGLVIRSPGTYTFGSDVVWRPIDYTRSAITIASSDVTLDLGGFTLTASVADPSSRIAGIVVTGPVDNVRITNGTIASVTEYGILARNVCGLNIAQITVTGVSLRNLAVRDLTPAGIQVSWCRNVGIVNCSVTQLAVTTDSSAGIQLMGTSGAIVTGCTTSGLVNNDGAVQGFSAIGCTNVKTTGCTASMLQSHFNGNVLTTGHTVLGFCPIFCQNLSYVNCTASGLTGCCDDCHGMSVFIDAQVTVSGFQANNVVDGVAPSNTGAKATGLEVYGAGVTVLDSAVSDIRAINPQDKQAAGFSAWGVALQFTRCRASNVSVHDDVGGSRGIGFGWAPDPRVLFRDFGARAVTYTDCAADRCDVGFDTWYHVDSSWVRPVATSCATAILVEPGGTRTLSGDACSECQPPIVVTLTNLAKGNTYPS